MKLTYKLYNTNLTWEKIKINRVNIWTKCFRASILCIILLNTIIPFSSCRKLVEVDPPFTSTNADNVFKTDETSIAVLTGIYTSLSQGRFITGTSGISFYSGLSADEFVLASNVTNPTQLAYYKNALAVNAAGFEYWNTIYPFIFKCNSAIEGLNASTTLTPSVKQQLLGEAKYLRGFFYFYLTNLFGDVPLALTSDYKLNASLPRTPKADVYLQIVQDLKDAEELLSANYLNGNLQSYPSTAERVRPNKSAASALLARVYLYLKDFAKADQQATLVINNGIYSLPSLNSAFLKNSTEVIWQLQPVNPGWNTEDARVFVINAAPGGSKPISLSSFLLNSFEIGDARRTVWVKDTLIGLTSYSFPYKYKIANINVPVNEYLMVMRLAELYLIRAEARAKQGNVAGSQADLNLIRSRAGLPNTTANSESDLLTAILQERRVELFSELGHRWLDLKRSGNIDAVMGTVTLQKGGTWSTNWQWYPIPGNDIQRNPGLIQNTGY